MIYFVQETGLFRSRVKIGLTDNIRSRIKGLRGGSPSSLKVLMMLPGDGQTEAAYHERFAKYRLHGEWFRFGLRLRIFVWANQFKPFLLDEPKEEIAVSDQDKDAKGLQQLGLEPDPLTFIVAPDPDPKPKYHADNVNAAIDELLSQDPDTFPTKRDVTESVGITGGSKYKLVIAIYNERFSDVIRVLHSEGLTNQQIAKRFGRVTCSGRFYYEVKTALNGDKPND